jgi:hypothetical protein
MLPPEIMVTIRQTGSQPDGSAPYLAVTARSSGDEICSNSFDFQPDLLIDIEPQWMLERAVPRYNGETIKRGPADGERLDEQEAKLAAYGQRLYGFLFGDGGKLKAFLEFNDSYRRQARLTLALHGNASALWRLPWEYLHDGDDFLVLHGRFLLSRVPYGLAEMQPPSAPLPLRILVVIAAPDDQKPLDTEEEIGVIQAALDEAVRAGRVQVEYLDDATLPAIGEALRRFRPHVLHYTGHGKYDEKAERSFLALEDDSGKTKNAGIKELRPHLKDARDLRLVVLSGCQTARTSDVDAFSGVATGLLRESIPAVLAMQYSILDQSGIKLAQAFYAALAQGETPAQAAQRARLALWQFDEGPGYDWGVPALYLRAQGMRLVDPDVGTQRAVPLHERAAALDVGGLPLPPYFVGRKPELRALRRALRDRHCNAVFVRGIGGMGKSSLAAKLMQRPGTETDGALVVRCHQVDPLDIPAKLARFLEAQGIAGHAEAAALLLDSRQPPADRARQALTLIADRRYLFVFDNLESVMDIPTLSPRGRGEFCLRRGQPRPGWPLRRPVERPLAGPVPLHRALPLARAGRAPGPGHRRRDPPAGPQRPPDDHAHGQSAPPAPRAAPDQNRSVRKSGRPPQEHRTAGRLAGQRTGDRSAGRPQPGRPADPGMGKLFPARPAGPVELRRAPGPDPPQHLSHPA